jgi:hypothetical protein
MFSRRMHDDLDKGLECTEFVLSNSYGPRLACFQCFPAVSVHTLQHRSPLESELIGARERARELCQASSTQLLFATVFKCQGVHLYSKRAAENCTAQNECSRSFMRH